ncbi:MFS transporter [Nocardia fluminea]|uniref:MFS transporter n=1 Tax=Nocardia fluminea TaxID=134984 RepID=UPI0033EEC002
MYLDKVGGTGGLEPRAGEEVSAASIGARLDRLPTGSFHYRLAGKLGIGTFFDGFDAIALAVVLTYVMHSLDIGLSEAGLIISAGYIGQFIGALVVGALADRFGRRKAFIVSLVVFGLLSLGCAIAWNAQSLMIFRAIQGLGLGAEVPIAGALINEYLGRKNRGRFAVIYQSAFSWGLFAAPLVGLAVIATVGEEAGWRILLGLGALPLLLAVWCWFSLPESARWLASRGDLTAADRYISRIEAESVARGTVLGPVDTATDSPAPRGRFSPAEVFAPQYRVRTVSLCAVWFLTFFVIYGYSTWLPTMYVRVGGLSAASSLTLTIVLSGVQILVVYVVAVLIERVGRVRLLVNGFALAAIGGLTGAVGIGLLGHTDWRLMFAAALVLAMGMTIPAGMLYMYTAELFPTRIRGFATSLCSSMNRLASIFSPVIVAAMLGGALGAGGVFGAFAIAAVAAAIVASIFGIETQRRSLEEISP